MSFTESKLTADQSTERDKVRLNIREHSYLDRVVVEAYDNEGRMTYWAAENADRPLLALAMLGEQTDRRPGEYMDVEDTVSDPRVADEDLAFFAYRSLAALQLRKQRRKEIAAEAAVAAARADEEREAGISSLAETLVGAHFSRYLPGGTVPHLRRRVATLRRMGVGPDQTNK